MKNKILLAIAGLAVVGLIATPFFAAQANAGQPRQHRVERVGPQRHAPAHVDQHAAAREARALGLLLGGFDAAREDAGEHLCATGAPVTLSLGER